MGFLNILDSRCNELEMMNVLKEQFDLFQELIELLRKEKDCLLNYSTDEFVQVFKQKEALSVQLDNIEEKRKVLFANTNLASFFNEEKAHNQFIKDYKATIVVIQELNEDIRMLMEVERSFIEDVVSLFDKVASGNVQTYGKSGASYQSTVVETTILNKKI